MYILLLKKLESNSFFKVRQFRTHFSADIWSIQYTYISFYSCNSG